ncbi:MAG: hypothetical protein ACRENP_04340 [Longimicrobiales bacterium]
MILTLDRLGDRSGALRAYVAQRVMGVGGAGRRRHDNADATLRLVAYECENIESRCFLTVDNSRVPK